MITDTNKITARSLFEKIATNRTDTLLFVNKTKFIETLQHCIQQDTLSKVKIEVLELENNLYCIKTDKIGVLNIHSNGDTIRISQKQITRLS